MNKTIAILAKHKIILIFHILYSALVFLVFFYNRSVQIPTLDELTDIAYIQSVLSAETKRILIIWVISGLFYSMIYYLIAKSVRDKKIYIWDLGKGITSYAFFVLIGLLMLIPVTVIFLLCIGLLSIPSVLISVPLLSGKESFFIPAIILWVVTFIFIIFGIFLFTLYVAFLQPGIFLITKNVFSAFKRTNRIVKDHFWKLLGHAILSIIHFAGLIYVYIQALIMQYKSADPFVSIPLWIGIILLSIFSIGLKTYVFVFLHKNSALEY